jgi:hypothetical protein
MPPDYSAIGVMFMMSYAYGPVTLTFSYGAV